MLRHIGLIALAASVVAGVSAAQAAVIAPYSNDFSASVDDFVASTAGGGWILDTDAGTYSHTTTTGARYTAALEVSNLGGADTIDFAITGKLVQSSATGTGTYVSLVALAPTSSFGGAALDGYTLRWRASSTFNTDCIELLRNGEVQASGGLNHRMSTNLDDVAEMTLAGSYVDTDGNGSKDALDLSVTFRNITDDVTYQFTWRDQDPLTGRYFGLHDYNNNSAAFETHWDSISITVVPEPTAVMFALGLGATSLMLRKRRA